MRNKHRIPGINSSATADLSFLLLIFFIITSSIDPHWMMPMHLSPTVPSKANHIIIRERDFLPVHIDGENRIFCRSTLVKASELRAYTKHFIKNPDNDENLPEKVPVNIPFLGETDITKNHIIALSNEDETAFRTYVFVQNELIAAYRELREELAMEKFGKAYHTLGYAEQEAVRTCYQRKISRPEQSGKGGRHE
ncbi:MAG: biopolymer transporter ExbD [Dysgonamonadaceae bacterium]|nr:biopolymer transporter ExbD [Dysgonamonadaceae bacterium]